MYLEEMFGLKGKVAIVTGGRRGIGQVVACGLAKAGAEVVIFSRTLSPETVKMIKDEGGNAYDIAGADCRGKGRAEALELGNRFVVFSGMLCDMFVCEDGTDRIFKPVPDMGKLKAFVDKGHQNTGRK